METTPMDESADFKAFMDVLSQPANLVSKWLNSFDDGSVGIRDVKPE